MKPINLLFLQIFLVAIFACNNDDNSSEETIVNTSDFIMDINEFPENGQVIGKIEASTNKGNLTFSIISQTPNDAFIINSSTGELKVLNKILYNFDLNPKLSGIVAVRNGDIISYANVSVNVKNVEKIFNGYVNIQSQAQLETFASNNYDRVNGTVQLIGATIVNTNNLSSIKFIEGDLYILGTNLENIDGFTNTNISNDANIQIINNPNLKNLNGLRSITNRLRNIDIFENRLINNIDGLINISNVTNIINISDTEYLTNLNGLAGIKNPVNHLTIRSNAGIVNTDGLSNIPKITSFSFINNDLVTSLSNMSSLVEINEFFLDNNDKLENINGLIKLETSRKLTIQNNVSLKNLNGLIKLRNVDNGNMNIIGNTSLRDFCGLGLIATISTVGYNIRDNFYNPNKDDIKNGNCSI